MTISIAQAQLFFLAFTRIMALLVQVPVLGGRTIPTRVRIPFGLAITLLMSPVALSAEPLPPDAPAMPMLVLGAAIAREIIVGSLAGFAAVLTFGTLQMAGELIGTSAGFGSGRVLNPLLESSGTVLDQLFVMVALLLFLVLNGHHLFLLAIQHTFVMVPLTSALPAVWLSAPTETAARAAHLTTELLGVGTLLALPVMGAGLLADVTLGLLSRVAPQIQVFFLGVPVKVGMSLLALSVALGLIWSSLSELLTAVGERALRLLGG